MSQPMDARVLVSVDEYLRAQFDGSDRVYLDGVVIERNLGELPHARLQARLTHVLSGLAETCACRS